MNIFAEKIWLIVTVLAVPAIIALFIALEKGNLKRLRNFVAAGLIGNLMGSYSPRRKWIKLSLLLVGIVALLLSLARPQWGFNWEEKKIRTTDLLIALDTSKSMLASDIKPNRLERSKLAILDLLESMEGDRVGLIAFSGSAFLQCPLTLDYEAFRQTLESVDTDIIQRGGTDVASAIMEAQEVLSSEGKNKVLILITDGEDLEETGVAQAHLAASAGIKIYTIGVGTTEGELIQFRRPDGSIDYIRDKAGNPVRSRLDINTLQEISNITGALFAPLGQQGEGLAKIVELSLQKAPREEKEARLQKKMIERYQWFLLPAIIFLAAEMLVSTRRRAGRGKSLKLKGNGSMTMALLAGIMFFSQSDLLPSVGDAQKAYSRGDYDQAAAAYEEALQKDEENPLLHFNLGTCYYRQGAYEEAIKHFELALKTDDLELQKDSFYNLGNTRYRLGQSFVETDQPKAKEYWNKAQKAFDSALEIDSEYEDAGFNKSIIKRRYALLPMFELKVLAQPADAGTVSQGGIFDRGVEVSIKAEASGELEFIRWEGEGIAKPEEAETHATLDTDITAIAIFAHKYQLTVEADDSSRGQVEKSGLYPEKTPIPIKATSNFGWRFVKWEGTGVAEPEKAETTVTIEKDTRIRATFVSAFELVFEKEESDE